MANGRFGIHGGQYIPETLMNAVIELEKAYNHYKNDPEFNRDIESAHAVAYAMKLAPAIDKDKIIVITISGRGYKDCAAIARYRGEDIYE